MTSHFLSVLSSPAVKAAQEANGSRAALARHDVASEPDRLGEQEAAFIAMRDSFYMATVGNEGWPYMQHRGGPEGFVKVLSERTFGFADFRGNRQYMSVGNLVADNRAAFFFMDYPNRARLKVLGRVRAVDLRTDAALAKALIVPGYRALPERALLVDVEAFDWNCSQHITPRYTVEQIEPTVEALKARIAELEVKLMGDQSTWRSRADAERSTLRSRRLHEVHEDAGARIELRQPVRSGGASRQKN